MTAPCAQAPRCPEGAPVSYAPRPGDIGLVRVNGAAGALIRLGQWLNGSGFEDYEHAFVYIGDGLVIEAEPGGAAFGELSRYPGAYWCQFTPSDAQRARIVTAARGYIGVRYSWADYFALAARRLHVPAPGLRGYIAASGSMICSQLCDKCCQDAGYRIFSDGRWPGDVAPGDLWLASQGAR